jgi:hypothetical protein
MERCLDTPVGPFAMVKTEHPGIRYRHSAPLQPVTIGLNASGAIVNESTGQSQEISLEW